MYISTMVSVIFMFNLRVKVLEILKYYPSYDIMMLCLAFGVVLSDPDSEYFVMFGRSQSTYANSYMENTFSW